MGKNPRSNIFAEKFYHVGTQVREKKGRKSKAYTAPILLPEPVSADDSFDEVHEDGLYGSIFSDDEFVDCEEDFFEEENEDVSDVLPEQQSTKREGTYWPAKRDTHGT